MSFQVEWWSTAWVLKRRSEDCHLWSQWMSCSTENNRKYTHWKPMITWIFFRSDIESKDCWLMGNTLSSYKTSKIRTSSSASQFLLISAFKLPSSGTKAAAKWDISTTTLRPMMASICSHVKRCLSTLDRLTIYLCRKKSFQSHLTWWWEGYKGTLSAVSSISFRLFPQDKLAANLRLQCTTVQSGPVAKSQRGLQKSTSKISHSSSKNWKEPLKRRI